MDERARELIYRYLDGECGEAETAELRRTIQANPEFAGQIFRAAEDQVALKEVLKGKPTPTAAVRAAAQRRRAGSRRRGRISKARAWLRYGVLPAAVAAAALITAHLVNLKIIADTQAALCAEVIELGGPVEIVSERGTAPIHKGSKVRPGESLKTGTEGYARLRYKDGTTIRIRKDTDLSLKKNASSRDPAKSLKLDCGEISADVTRQPDDAAMILSTLNATAKVLGTRFTLRAGAAKTRLEVAQGKVRLTRTADGASVNVAGGYYAVAAPGKQVVAMRIKPLPAPAEKPIFAEDFGDQALGSLPAAFTAAYSGRWTVKDVAGTRALHATGQKCVVSFGESEWTDYEVRVRVRFDAAPNRLGVIVRHDPKTRRNCQLELRPDGAYLVRSAGAQGDQPPSDIDPAVRPTAGVWHDLRAVCRGKSVELYVDGKRVLSTRAAIPASGHCKLYVKKGSATFDNIEVLKLKPQKR